jgi:phosphoribosylformylglycinamidine synthase I
MRPPVLVLHAAGTNRDREAALACELAGGAPEIVTLHELVSGDRDLSDFRMLVLPGGFSYGDDLGAGKMWAVALRHGLREALAAFVEAGRPVLGICNGFQALLKSGLLPGTTNGGAGGGGAAAVFADAPFATLAENASGRFECRWVRLEAEPESRCLFTADLPEPVLCPVAHGEGRFVVRDEAGLAELEGAGLVALRYAGPGGERSPGYPANPNGSVADIAGICNPRGNVLGMMPHPEDHVFEDQHPRRHRGERGMGGLPLFERGVRRAAEL